MYGRFISSDPIGFGGGDANLYRYASSNPVQLIDPFGLDTITYGASIRVPTWLAEPIAQIMGSEVSVHGGSFGVAFSFPGLFGGEWDSGIYGSLDVGGMEIGAKVVGQFSYLGGSVCDLAGMGMDMGFQAGPYGGGIIFNDEGESMSRHGIYVQRGVGVAAGYSATAQGVWSRKHGPIGFQKK